MTTYVIEGISLDSFSTATLSFLAPDTRLKLDYTVNWREPDGLFNSSFDVSAYDIYLNGQSILAPSPFLDIYFVEIDWHSRAENSFVLNIYDTLSDESYLFRLGGEKVPLPKDAAALDAFTADIANASNPLPGSGFATGEPYRISRIPGVLRTEDDLIVGDLGPDVFDGGLGDDTLLGAGSGDHLLGGMGNDLLRGQGGEDTLEGGEGADTLEGGNSADVYVGVEATDVLVERYGHTGRDRVETDHSFSLGNTNIEDLTLTGDVAVNGTGNGGDNVLRGNAAANHLDGRRGADTLLGGAGDDVYFIDDLGDHIGETAHGGSDLVYASVTHALDAHVEDLVLTGTDAIDGTGTNGANKIIGNMAANRLWGRDGADRLSGKSGDDTLHGGEGRDTLIGGRGSDTYIVDSAFTPGSSNDRYYSLRGQDLVVERAAHAGIDTVLSFSSFDAQSQHIENITLVGNAHTRAWGNQLDNVLRGNLKNNFLAGRDGDDLLLGGAGNGNDTLQGGAGSDTMIGGGGHDTYFVTDLGDRVVEKADGGTDTLYINRDTTLAQTLENLYLQGSARVGNGNAKNNRIFGTIEDTLLQGLAGNDSLYGSNGHDTLKGGLGADYMAGGRGNDVYFIDHANDRVNEYWYSGYDKVISSVSITSNHNYRVEEFVLLGTEDLDVTAYTWGSALIRGNAGNNVLRGATGVDTMLGGLGDDTFHVSNSRDQVIEGAGAGHDKVVSSVNYHLSAHVEALELIRGRSGIGNGLDNQLTGSRYDDTLIGREGSDTLTGAAGADTFVFDRALGSDNVDTVTDFISGVDTILLRSTHFAGLSAGALPASALRGGTAAVDADDRIIYNRSTGELFFDSDGTGSATQVLFAVLGNTPYISSGDFDIL